MAQNLTAITSMLPKILASTQLAGTTGTAVYTVPTASSAIIKHGVVCNVGAAAVNVTVSIVPASGTFDGTHSVVYLYSLASHDSLPLGEYLAGANLGPGDAIYIQSSVAASLDVTVTGVESA